MMSSKEGARVPAILGGFCCRDHDQPGMPATADGGRVTIGAGSCNIAVLRPVTIGVAIVGAMLTHPAAGDTGFLPVVNVTAALSSTYNDGAAGSPAGVPELRTLFAGYATRPPWKVAGVDYAVGVPSETVLKDPTLMSVPGVAIDAINHLVRINGNNVTLSGYDFALHNGWGVYIASGITGTVIENSNFEPGSNAVIPINALVGAGSLWIERCTFKGGAVNSAIWALVNYNGSGNFVAEYDAFENASEDAIDFSRGTVTPEIRYNLFYNLGLDPGSHPDAVQYEADAANNSVIEFNTIYQPTGFNGSTGMQGIQISAQDGSTITNTVVRNNSIIAKGPALTMSYSVAVGGSSPNVLNGVVVSNNYIDATGAYGPFYPPSGRNLTFTNNIDLITGKAFASPSGTAATDVIGISATRSGSDTVNFLLIMNRPMTVTGTPLLMLNNGGVATYSGGSGSSVLKFTHSLASARVHGSVVAITSVKQPGDVSIKDVAGNPPNLTGAKRSFPELSIP